MAINCETFILTKETCRTLLQAVEKNLTEKFMPLWNLSWCSYYYLESRVIKYSDKKTQIIEFYWFNHSPVRHNEHKQLYESFVCKCIHCIIFSPNKK